MGSRAVSGVRDAGRRRGVSAKKAGAQRALSRTADSIDDASRRPPCAHKKTPAGSRPPGATPHDSNLRIVAIPHNEIDRERFQYREPRDHSARVSHSLRARRADIATAPRL